MLFARLLAVVGRFVAYPTGVYVLYTLAVDDRRHGVPALVVLVIGLTMIAAAWLLARRS